MRKIEQQMVEAVQSCLDGSDKGWRSGNTEVFVHHHGDRNHWCYQRTVIVRLHGNVIAEFDSALNGARDCRGLTLRDCGYETKTTKSRLNALLWAFRDGSRIYQKQGQWYCPDGTEWLGAEWFTYQSLEANSVYDAEFQRAITEAVFS